MTRIRERLANEAEVHIQEQVDERVSRMEQMQQQARMILRARKHIEEDILQMKCPRVSCRKAFFDFDGCFAISCSHCPCHFCGWCLKDCGNSSRLAHLHVRSCTAKPPNADVFFGSLQDFQSTYAARCRTEVFKYLGTLEQELRDAVMSEMRNQLQELGVVSV